MSKSTLDRTAEEAVRGEFMKQAELLGIDTRYYHDITNKGWENMLERQRHILHRLETAEANPFLAPEEFEEMLDHFAKCPLGGC